MIADRPRIRSTAGLVLAVLLLLACGGGTEGDATEESSANPAPDFTLERLGGDAVTLSALRGKVVIIDFWATWCPPCEFQVPELNAFYEAHGASGQVEVLGVSVDTDGPEVVEAWIREKGVEYPILLGDESLARRFGALGFPTLAVVDAAGNIESLHVGLIERDELEEHFERVLAAPGGGEAPLTPGSG